MKPLPLSRDRKTKWRGRACRRILDSAQPTAAGGPSRNVSGSDQRAAREMPYQETHILLSDRNRSQNLVNDEMVHHCLFLAIFFAFTPRRHLREMRAEQQQEIRQEEPCACINSIPFSLSPRIHVHASNQPLRSSPGL